MKCKEETPKGDNVILGCTDEAMPGLDHCQEHAQQRLALARYELNVTMTRMNARSRTLLDLEIQLAREQHKHQRDKATVLGALQQIEELSAVLEAPP